jgi:hypothetical protein
MLGKGLNTLFSGLIKSDLLYQCMQFFFRSRQKGSNNLRSQYVMKISKGQCRFFTSLNNRNSFQNLYVFLFHQKQKVIRNGQKKGLKRDGNNRKLYLRMLPKRRNRHGNVAHGRQSHDGVDFVGKLLFFILEFSNFF